MSSPPLAPALPPSAPPRQGRDPVAPASRSIASLLLILTAVALMVLDLIAPSAASGVLVLGAHATIWIRDARRFVPLWSRRSRRSVTSRLLSIELALLVVLAGFAAARAYVSSRQLLPDPLSLRSHAAAARTYAGIFLFAAALLEVMSWRTALLARGLGRVLRRPAFVLATSFATLITVGTLLLSLPLSVHSFAQVSLVDSLFTITSAVSVTGLATQDPGSTYTAFGQAVILVCIQLGAVGLMTIAAMTLSFRREASLDDQAKFAQMLAARTLSQMRVLVRSLIISTLCVETIGTALLWLRWRDSPALGGRSPLWCAIFHAVSAFCNAGFSLFSDSMAPFLGDGWTLAILMSLVVLGGIGFPVLVELTRRVAIQPFYNHDLDRPRPVRFSLGTRVALGTTLVLLLGGTALVGLLEWRHSLGALGPGRRILGALFASVSARTAGFSVVDLARASSAGLFTIMLLMFIGGSPGSAAGGIKTTTVAVLFATVRAELLGREPRLGGRTLELATIRRAVAVGTTSLGTIALALIALLVSEQQDFLALTFETVSAFSTTGLSVGITPRLSTVGKLILVATMFLGRVGPLTVALAVGRRVTRSRQQLPAEDVPIG